MGVNGERERSPRRAAADEKIIDGRRIAAALCALDILLDI